MKQVWGDEADEGAHGRGGEERAEDPALAGPQGACLMTGQATGQPGEEETPREAWKA